MSTALDMSLDDLIKKNKKYAGGYPRGRGRGSGPGPDRRLPNRATSRAAPYSVNRPTVFSNRTPVLTNPAMAANREMSIETGTKLYISNLDYGVSNQDIKELFSEIGDLKRFSIHYVRSGRSKGTAEVVFSKRSDALAAVNRYNNAQLDGKPMNIEIVGTNIPAPKVVPQVLNGGFGHLNSIPRSSGPGKAISSGRLLGGAFGGSNVGRGRGRGRGRGKDRGRFVSASELDVDLMKYHEEAM